MHAFILTALLIGQPPVPAADSLQAAVTSVKRQAKYDFGLKDKDKGKGDKGKSALKDKPDSKIKALKFKGK